jgi:hypothetical protein
MSLTYFERQIIDELHAIIGKRIREKDMLEWRTAKIAKRDGERVVHVSRLKVWVAIPDTIKVKSATVP